MVNDLTKETLAVLLVLSLIVTVLGTWTVLDRVNSADYQPTNDVSVMGPSSTSARVSLAIGEMPDPTESSSEAKVSLSIGDSS